MDITELVLGAVLGTALSYFFPFIQEKIKKEIKRKRIINRQNLLQGKRISDWLIDYYKSNGHENDLYDCKIGNFEIKIPFLTKKEWLFFKPIDEEFDGILLYAETADQKFPIDSNLLNKRRELGQNLFDNPILYLDRIEEEEHCINLHVKSCRYYQAVTALASLEEETFRAVKGRNNNKLLIRDSYFPNIAQVQKLSRKPFNIGCTTALAIKTPKDSYELVIQTRSHLTITFGGSKAVIPTFGLTPIINRKTADNIIFYNFIKEYCEELFNYEELIAMMNTKRANPYWFYELPEAADLLSLKKHEGFSLEYLGFGFDALNGSALIGLLGIINDDKYSVKLKDKIITNWEVAERTMDLEPLEFIDMNSPKLENWLKENQYHYGSAFTISRAIERLHEMDKI